MEMVKGSQMLKTKFFLEVAALKREAEVFAPA
jgi:hypothetical protein